MLVLSFVTCSQWKPLAKGNSEFYSGNPFVKKNTNGNIGMRKLLRNTTILGKSRWS